MNPPISILEWMDKDKPKKKVTAPEKQLRTVYFHKNSFWREARQVHPGHGNQRMLPISCEAS